MNCCWILLLLLCCGGGCGGRTTSGRSGCGCAAAREETACRRERVERENDREACDGGSREETSGGCDVANMIPPTWQEYAKRDTDGCED